MLVFLDFAYKYQLSFQDPATPMMNGIIDLHHYVMFFLIMVLIFVVINLYNVVKFFIMEIKYSNYNFVQKKNIINISRNEYSFYEQKIIKIIIKNLLYYIDDLFAIIYRKFPNFYFKNIINIHTKLNYFIIKNFNFFDKQIEQEQSLKFKNKTKKKTKIKKLYKLINDVTLNKKNNFYIFKFLSKSYTILINKKKKYNKLKIFSFLHISNKEHDIFLRNLPFFLHSKKYTNTFFFIYSRNIFL